MRRFDIFPALKKFCFVLLIVVLIFLNCRKTGDDPARTLTRLFYLLNEGSYKKAASLFIGDIDPALLDFTNIVTLRFIDKIIVKEKEVSEDRASYYVFLFLKDGKQFAYYRRTLEGNLIPGVMKLKKVEMKSGKYEWKIEYDDFWETQRWQDISRKTRLNLITLVEAVIKYRDSEGSLPKNLEIIWSESLRSIVNPVTGEEEAIVGPDDIKPGVMIYNYDSERDEVDIKGYDVNGEELDYFIVAHALGTEKAALLEFFDVPPIVMSTVIPAYPESERKKNIEGVVSLQLLIGRDGMVHEVDVKKSLSAVFDSVAVNAVKHSVFSPAKRNGKPVAIWYYFPVRFVLGE